MTTYSLLPLTTLSRFALVVTVLSLTFLTFAQDAAQDSLRLAGNAARFEQQLDQLVSEAIANNPSLKAAGSRVDQSSAAARGAAALDPPRFTIEAMDASISSFPNPFRDQMEMDYSIEQMIPFPGMLGNMKKAERKRTDMLLHDKSALRNDLIRQVRENFYDLYAIDRQMQINLRSQAIVEQIVAVARTQYEVGMAKQTDILRAQTELSLLKKRLAQLEQQRTSMVGMLNALRAQPVTTPIDTVPEIAPDIVTESLDAMITKALSTRPEISSMQSSVEMSRYELKSANRQWFPDFMVKATYQDIRPLPVNADPMGMGTDPGIDYNADRWSVMLGITIPSAPWSYRRANATQRRRAAEVAQAQSELANMENMVRAEVLDAYAQVQSSIRQLQLSTSSLVPQARLAFESALASYRTGGQEFTMLLDTERMLIMAQEEYHMSVMKYLTARARLDRAIGVTIAIDDR